MNILLGVNCVQYPSLLVWVEGFWTVHARTKFAVVVGNSL